MRAGRKSIEIECRLWVQACENAFSRDQDEMLNQEVGLRRHNDSSTLLSGFNCCAIGLGVRVFTQPGSFADMQQSPRERPLPGAKQTYLGQPRVGRRVYGKELFSV